MKPLPRVLIADDTPDLLKPHLLALTLAPAVARAQGARDGSEALAAYREAKQSSDPFDLLILDLAMPSMNGFSVAEKIREEGDSSTRILFFTNYDDDIENELRARACGALGVWCKSKRPYFRDDVRALLAQDNSEFEASPIKKMPNDAVGILAKSKLKREKSFMLVGWLVAGALVANIGLTLYNMARTPRVYSAISSIDRKLDGAVSTAQLPAGYRVIVPAGKQAYKEMAHKKEESGRVRVMFEFEAKDAAAAASIAQNRGVPLYLSVTRAAGP